MVTRKRARDEVEEPEVSYGPRGDSQLDKIRNMWEFASVMQFIFIFGKAVKIDEDFDIELAQDFETECLKPERSGKLEEIGLTMLKWISSHRGLDLTNWDEYTRRQYVSKAPGRNPYGEEEEPKNFRNFDIFQKIRILHQLSIWTFWNADRMRERMPQEKEAEQTEWRIEELGYDREERQYYVLDDNRLYRRTEPPLPPAPQAKPKANSLKAQAARRRANKRRRIVEDTPDVTEGEDSHMTDAEETKEIEVQKEDTFGRFKWECICITLSDYETFCESYKKTKDSDEKALVQRVKDSIIPVILAAEESQRRKIERKERELLNVQRLAGAKRSSRLAGKQEKEKQEQEAAEATRKHAEQLAAAHREQERQEKMDQDRQSRMMTREQRIKDREYKRILHEEELARMEEEAKKVEAGESSRSERHLKAEMEKRKKDLEELSAEEDWTFDCSGCGVHGKNIDDGSHSVACEKCNVWQHSKCLGVTKAAAEKDDFHFACKDCKQKEEDAKRPKISLKFRAGLSSSPPQPQQNGFQAAAPSPTQSTFAGVQIPVDKKRGPGRPPKQSPLPISHRPSSSGQNVTYQGLQQHPMQQQHSSYGFQNGYHTQQYQPQLSPYANGHRPLQSFSPNVQGAQGGSPPPTAQPNVVARPGSGYGQYPHQQQYIQPPYSPPQPQQFGHVSPGRGAYLPNGQPRTSQVLSPQQQRLPPSYDGARSPPARVSPQKLRQVSPINNAPAMRPTQGNDLSRPGGIPVKSPTFSNSHNTFAHQTPASHQHRPNGISPPPNFQAAPVPLARSPNYSLNNPSGISPLKRSPSIMQQSPPTHSLGQVSPHLSATQSINHVLPPSSATPSVAAKRSPSGTLRSVSGTPIFPPTENLAPTSQQMNKQPVPTPSKQPTPAKIGEQELQRVTVAAINANSNIGASAMSIEDDSGVAATPSTSFENHPPLPPTPTPNPQAQPQPVVQHAL